MEEYDEKQLLATLFCSTALFGSLMINQISASAHGYVESPPSRGYQGAIERNTIGYSAAWEKYGAVITNPQSLEAKKDFHKLVLRMDGLPLRKVAWAKSVILSWTIKQRVVGQNKK